VTCTIEVNDDFQIGRSLQILSRTETTVRKTKQKVNQQHGKCIPPNEDSAVSNAYS